MIRDVKRRVGEASFTLIETVIAVGLLAALMMEVIGVQGNAIGSTEYGRKVSLGVWLAKRVMAQVEYNLAVKTFDDLDVEIKEKPFDDMREFTYSLTIKEWKLPIVDMLVGGMGGGGTGEDGEESSNPMAGMIKDAIKNFLGDQILKTAEVEVFWAEGARRDSVKLALLLPNQRKLDEIIATLKPPKQNDTKKKPDDQDRRRRSNPNDPNNPGGGNPGEDGAPPPY